MTPFFFVVVAQCKVPMNNSIRLPTRQKVTHHYRNSHIADDFFRCYAMISSIAKVVGLQRFERLKGARPCPAVGVDLPPIFPIVGFLCYSCVFVALLLLYQRERLLVSMLRLLSSRSTALGRLRSPSAFPARGLQGLVVGVPKESLEGEHRVALVPGNVVKLKKAGASVKIESGAGAMSGFTDDLYKSAGAEIVPAADAWKSQVVAKVRPPTAEEAARIENRAIVSIIQPRVNTDLMAQLVKQKATVLSLDSLLRTLSRGQSFDVLSSQANVAGYRAVIEAAHFMQRPFAGQMTAAGKIQPAKVLVVGAGVAGLAAIQLAKKKGAIVYGFDVRAAAKEQVESCGAKFLEVSLGEDGSGAGGYAKVR